MQFWTVGCHLASHTHTHTHDVTANKNKARKAVERKLLRDSSAVPDVFRLYGEMSAARHDGAACNPAGQPAALWSEANHWHHPYSSSAPRAPVSASYLQEFTHTRARARVCVCEPRKQEQEDKKSGWRKLLRSCRAALDVLRSVKVGWSATERWRARVQNHSLLPSLDPDNP